MLAIEAKVVNQRDREDDERQPDNRVQQVQKNISCHGMLKKREEKCYGKKNKTKKVKEVTQHKKTRPGSSHCTRFRRFLP